MLKKKTDTTKVITIANQKGGVAKTTTAFHLTASLARDKYSTLLIDLDPQFNQTEYLFGDQLSESDNMYHVMLEDMPLGDIICEFDQEEFLFAPSGEIMAEAEINLASHTSRENKLKGELAEYKKLFDFIIIDTPPSLGLLTMNALIASDYVIIPVSPKKLSLSGLSLLNKNIKKVVSEGLNRKLKMLGYLITIYDKREKHTTRSENDLNKNYNELVFKAIIRTNTNFSNSTETNESIFTVEGKEGRGAQDYNEFYKEFKNKINY